MAKSPTFEGFLMSALEYLQKMIKCFDRIQVGHENYITGYLYLDQLSLFFSFWFENNWFKI